MYSEEWNFRTLPRSLKSASVTWVMSSQRRVSDFSPKDGSMLGIRSSGLSSIMIPQSLSLFAEAGLRTTVQEFSAALAPSRSRTAATL